MDLLSQLLELNTDSLSILNIRAHSSLVVRTLSNLQDKPASMTMLLGMLKYGNSEKSFKIIIYAHILWWSDCLDYFINY